MPLLIVYLSQPFSVALTPLKWYYTRIFLNGGILTMAIPIPQTPAERFRTVTLRVNRNTRIAQVDGLQDIYYLDTLRFVVDNVSGVDPADVQFWLWKKEAGQTTADALVTVSGFTLVTGSASRMYKDITFSGDNLLLATSALQVGTPLTCHVIVRENNMALVSMDVNVFANP
jgi:hypothetical protein